MHTIYMFDCILGHEGCKGLLKTTDPQYKGSKYTVKYNVQIQWSDGSVTAEPLSVITTIMQDDAVECAKYATEHGLLNTAGWKKLKSVAKHHRAIAVNKSKYS